MSVDLPDLFFTDSHVFNRINCKKMYWNWWTSICSSFKGGLVLLSLYDRHLKAHNWQYWKSRLPACPCHKMLIFVRGALNFFFQVGVCGPDFRSVGLANWHLPLKRGACERKISKFGGLWAENFQIWGLVSYNLGENWGCEAKISEFSLKGVL